MTDPSIDGWFEGGEHVRPVRVYYEDTDFSGVVYHAQYLAFFERGRTDFLRCAGVGHAELEAAEEPRFFVVRKIAVEYATPARIDDLLHVRTRFFPSKGARLTISQQMVRGEELVATAEVEAACIDGAGRPKRLPKDAAAKISAAMGA
ncbi:MAG: tol-pal system-associated acyl-CoA thioesterase [Pseudomonadota bacterium]